MQNNFYFFQFINPHEAFSMALQMAISREPFASYQMKDLIPTLRGQINRRHYLFVQTDDGQIEAYLGWAMCREDIAIKTARDGYTPSYEECLSGDNIVVFTFIALTRVSCRALAKFGQTMFPRTKCYFRRNYANPDKKSHWRVLATGNKRWH